MSSLSIVCIVLTFAVSLLLPPAFLVFYALRHKKQGIWSAWLLGAAGFLVPQILIRFPILAALSRTDGFVAFAQAHPLIYGFALAFTAGLFEVVGRYAVARVLKKNLTYNRALAAGLGHGGIEAILITGLAYVSNLVFLVMLQTGGFEAAIAQTTAAGGDVTALLTAKDALMNTPWTMFLLAGFERLLAMTCHAALSMLVCYGVHSGKAAPTIFAFAMHVGMDCVASISLMIGKGLSQATAYTIIYTLLMAFTVLAIVILKTIRARWAAEEAQEVPYDSQA